MSLILLTGCWNRMELDHYGFVQGVAVDMAKDRKNIELTIQFYKPMGGTKQSGGPTGQSLINIKTRGRTVFDAIRDMTIHFGRKAQWSHMRVLIIGEELAKERNIGEVLDFFSRDHEPRSTVSVMIGKHRADQYFTTSKPFIETTIGQQLRESERMAYKYTGKSLKTSFLDLMLELKGKTGVAVVPYVYFDPKNKPVTSPVSGLALMRKGKMVMEVPPKMLESLLMLKDRYQKGVIEVECPGESKKKLKKVEAVEVESLKTKLGVKISGDAVAVEVSTKLKGYTGELLCTTLKTPDDVTKFNERVRKTVEKEIRRTIALIQKQKLDALGIGDRIYRHAPAKWKRWEPEWEERFAAVPFTVKVEASIINTSVNLGEPVAKLSK
ncbi:Ger(x)C family spore germination protein [Paenibacillus sp. P26]|nr:Ger(x)C family spore germination protein [Paenibacillus sp. P26]